MWVSVLEVIIRIRFRGNNLDKIYYNGILPVVAASDSRGGLPRSFSQVGHLIDTRNHMPSVPDMPNATYEDGRLFQNSQNDTAHQMHMLQQEQHMAQLQYHNEQGYHNDRAEENNYYEDTRNPIQQYSEELHEPQIYQTEEHQHNSTYDLDQNQMLEENRGINGLAGDVENSQVLAGRLSFLPERIKSR